MHEVRFFQKGEMITMKISKPNQWKVFLFTEAILMSAVPSAIVFTEYAAFFTDRYGYTISKEYSLAVSLACIISGFIGLFIIDGGKLKITINE